MTNKLEYTPDYEYIQELLLNGEIIIVQNGYEHLLTSIITKINIMGINTLMIQQADGGYYIKVDDKTVEHWKVIKNDKRL